MEKVTGVPGEHMTREQTLDGVEEIIGKTQKSTGEKAATTESDEAKEPHETPAEDESERDDTHKKES